MPRNFIPPPYGVIADELKAGAVVPFLGAGVNYGHRIPRNAKWTGEPSLLLQPDDLKDPAGLALRLKSPDPVASFLRSKLSHRTQRLLAEYEEGSPVPERLIATLVQEFNRLSRTSWEREFLESTGLPADISHALESLTGHALHRLRKILTELFPDYIRPFGRQDCNFLPDGAELSRYLAGKAGFTAERARKFTDLAKISSYLVETSARATLRNYLHDVLDRNYPPCPIHLYLAELSAAMPAGKQLVIVTTNYDDLLERAFKQVEAERIKGGLPIRPYDLVVHPSDHQDIAGSVLFWKHGATTPEAFAPNDLHLELDNRTVLYKMHGSVVRSAKAGVPPGNDRSLNDSFVITEEDYVEFLSRMTYQSPVPGMLVEHFSSRQFLFLGYGLNDWNLRVLLHSLRGAPMGKLRNGKETRNTRENASPAEAQPEPEAKPKSWAIQFRPTELERRLWQAREVNIFDVDINEFVGDLTAATVLTPEETR